MADNGLYIVTGATGGIGRALAEGLYRRGLRVVMACRNAEKAEAVRREICSTGGEGRLSVRSLDLASLRSVVRFAAELRAEGETVAALVNNAGVMNGSLRRTEDGFEETLGVNYLGAYALTRLLLPAVREGGRIVDTLSVTYRIGRIDKDLMTPDPERYGRFRAYGSSKLALLLFTLELARRTAGRGIGVYAADPGIVDTGMITMGRWFDPLADRLFRPLIKSPGRGAATALALASGELPGDSPALYWTDGKPRRIPREIVAHPLREWLWDETQRRAEHCGIVFA